MDTNKADRNPIVDWQERVKSIGARVSRLTESIHNRGWTAARLAGIPRCGYCLHNWPMTVGEYKTGEKKRLALLAQKLVDDWSISDLGSRLSARLWNRIVAPKGYMTSNECPGRPIVPEILFQVIERKLP